MTSARDLAKVLRRCSTLAAEGAPDSESVSEALARGLAVRHGKALRLTETGAAWLRRHLSSGDPFAGQHQAREMRSLHDEDRGRVNVAVNIDESPLARMIRQRGRDGKTLIDAAEFAAGERLRADYTRGQIMPRVTANWSASVADSRRDGGAGGFADLTAAVLSARQRVDRALDAIGAEFASILVDFCCFLKGIEEIERDRQWPVRSAKLVIRLGLSALARHYGLANETRGRERNGRLRHWGAPDYRPTLDGS